MVDAKAHLRRYQTLMKYVRDGIHVMDIQGDIVEVNDAFCDMLGYTQEETAQLNIADWNAQYTKDELLARLKNFVGINARFETLHRRKDGVLINVEVSTTGIDIEGQTFFFASSRDITERKKAEEALKAREERFQSLFDQASEGILLVSSSGKLIAANESFARMHGYTPLEMQTMNLHDLDTPEGVCMIPERMRRIFSGESVTFEVENYHKDGHIILIEVSARMIVVDDEPLVQSFVRDITGRKEIEKTIQFLTHIYAAQSQGHLYKLPFKFSESVSPLML